MKKICVLALILCLGTSSVYAYNSDGHYWTVYLVATLLKLPNAQELAYYAELPDNVMHPDGSIKRGTFTWLDVHKQGKVHALTGKTPEKERQRSRDMIANAATIKEKGRGLHRLGDSYAHAKPHDDRMYKRGFGHAFTPEGGHEPDMIRNYPQKYLLYVQDLAKVLGGDSARIDMTAFAYIAEKKLETADNIEILKTEICIQKRVLEYEIGGAQAKTVTEYLGARTQQNRSAGLSFTTQTLEAAKKAARTKVVLVFAV